MSNLNRLAALSAAAVMAVPHTADTKVVGDGTPGVSHMKRRDIADETRRAAKLVLSGHCDVMHVVTANMVGIPPSARSRTISGPFGGINEDGGPKMVRMEASAGRSGEPESLSVSGRIPAFSNGVRITDQDLDGVVDGVGRQETSGKFGVFTYRPIHRPSSEATEDAQNFFRDAIERALDQCGDR